VAAASTTVGSCRGGPGAGEHHRPYGLGGFSNRPETTTPVEAAERFSSRGFRGRPWVFVNGATTGLVIELPFGRDQGFSGYGREARPATASRHSAMPRLSGFGPPAREGRGRRPRKGHNKTERGGGGNNEGPKCSNDDRRNVTNRGKRGEKQEKLEMVDKAEKANPRHGQQCRGVSGIGTLAGRSARGREDAGLTIVVVNRHCELPKRINISGKKLPTSRTHKDRTSAPSQPVQIIVSSYTLLIKKKKSNEPSVNTQRHKTPTHNLCLTTRTSLNTKSTNTQQHRTQKKSKCETKSVRTREKEDTYAAYAD